MAKRIAVNSLDASSIDIINTIRANANYEYQSLVPVITQSIDIPKVGEVLFGYPALANQFLASLMNRIAQVRIKSAVFNNAYAKFKKGYLEYGETVEEVFVNICKAREFSAEKAEARELKRSIPDVRAAFHTMNWRVQYPITIQDEDLKMAFTSAEGVRDLIAKVVGMVTTAAEYDEMLLTKYLLIKAISHGKVHAIPVNPNSNTAIATAFRAASNKLSVGLPTKYNAMGVHNATTRDNQYIIMDSDYNATFDVDVLSAAFHMDKATFMGHLTLMDDWTTFDNERFDQIRAASDMIEEVTDEELAIMGKVKAVLVDSEWFQIYDNLTRMTETYVASGMYWNYFYNVWKTVSSSPFSNAVVFVDNTATTDVPNTYTLTVTDKSVSEGGTVLSFTIEDETASLVPSDFNFIQSETATIDGIAIHKYGAIIFPPLKTDVELHLSVKGTEYVSAELEDTTYSKIDISSTLDVGDTVLVAKASLL